MLSASISGHYSAHLYSGSPWGLISIAAIQLLNILSTKGTLEGEMTKWMEIRQNVNLISKLF